MPSSTVVKSPVGVIKTKTGILRTRASLDELVEGYSDIYSDIYAFESTSSGYTRDYKRAYA